MTRGSGRRPLLKACIVARTSRLCGSKFSPMHLDHPEPIEGRNAKVPKDDPPAQNVNVFVRLSFVVASTPGTLRVCMADWDLDGDLDLLPLTCLGFRLFRV